MGRFVFAGIILLSFWIVLSGHYTIFLISAGIISTILTVIVARYMKVLDAEYPSYLLTKSPGYLLWLVREIIKSAWSVTKIVLHPKMPISPTMRWVKATQHRILGRVIYANSITLTPGTISVDLVGDKILVHALTNEGVVSLEDGDMDRRVTKFEGHR